MAARTRRAAAAGLTAGALLVGLVSPAAAQRRPRRRPPELPDGGTDDGTCRGATTRAAIGGGLLGVAAGFVLRGSLFGIGGQHRGGVTVGSVLVTTAAGAGLAAFIVHSTAHECSAPRAPTLPLARWCARVTPADSAQHLPERIVRIATDTAGPGYAVRSVLGRVQLIAPDQLALLDDEAACARASAALDTMHLRIPRGGPVRLYRAGNRYFVVPVAVAPDRGTFALVCDARFHSLVVVSL